MHDFFVFFNNMLFLLELRKTIPEIWNNALIMIIAVILKLETSLNFIQVIQGYYIFPINHVTPLRIIQKLPKF